MDSVTLEDDRLRVIVDGRSGALREVLHKPAGITLIAQPEVAVHHPFMIVLADGTTVRGWRECTVRQAGEEALVRWSLDGGLTLTARLRLEAASGELRCTLALANPASLPLAAVAYPYIAGIGRLAPEAEQDELVHPYATGFLVRNPLDHLPRATTETEGQQPVVLGLYPEGFSGSTMQFMAYSAVGRGGFYVAAEDSVGKEKWLNFYRHPDGDLRLALWHGPADYAFDRSIVPDYATVLAALDGGTWYDAAERYKVWALSQPWTAAGPLWSRDDRCRWLLEDVGLCTFGINPRHNRAAWLERIDQIAGTPVLHLLGPNWSKHGSDYMGAQAGGLEDWFPASFHPENLAVIRRQRDYLVPFEFDLLFGQGDDCSKEAAGGIPIPQGTEMINEQMLPFVAFYQARAEACPAAPFEAGPFRELIKAGVAEKIPLFAYVYHEYGPVRLDGWANLSREQGDLVYFVLGRILLQGGLIELNYEFSALEDLGQYRDTAAEHYYLFDDRHYAIDPELAEFIGRLSQARVGDANRYLAYGAMERPAPLVVQGEATVELSYFLYNCSTKQPEYEDRGALRVPAVLQSAWRYRNESAAWLLLNIAPEERGIELTLDPPLLGAEQPSPCHLAVHREGAPAQQLGILSNTRVVALTLPPRCPVMLEASPLERERR